MSYHRKNRDKACRLYARTGQCSFGDVCKYSHERGGSFKPPASFDDRIWSHSQVNSRAASPVHPCGYCERCPLQGTAAQIISGSRLLDIAGMMQEVSAIAEVGLHISCSWTSLVVLCSCGPSADSPNVIISGKAISIQPSQSHVNTPHHPGWTCDVREQAASH